MYYIKHEEQCVFRYPMWVEKRGAAEVFLTDIKVFGYLKKHSFEC